MKPSMLMIALFVFIFVEAKVARYLVQLVPPGGGKTPETL